MLGGTGAQGAGLALRLAAAGHTVTIGGLYAGPSRNSAAVEALTSVLITINRRHKVAGSGIRITGLPKK